MLHLIPDPGTPYQVRIVAFTSVGMGVLGDYTVFFSEELTPTKPPENVQVNYIYKWLSPTILNVTWTPLSLFEAQGFPQYRAVLSSLSNDSQKRQLDANVMITKNSFAIFSNVASNIQYYVVVGVKTGGSSSFLDGDPLNGKVVIVV